MMIVYGVANPTVACMAPCNLGECSLSSNQPYILPTPPIGVNVSQALIIGAVIGIVLEITFVIFALIRKDEPFCSSISLIPVIPFLAAVAWMIVSFIVYTQTRSLCSAYKSQWSVDMTALKWLLGANIGGFILLLGPYVVPFVLQGLSAPCSESDSKNKNVSCFECMCPVYSNCVQGMNDSQTIV